MYQNILRIFGELTIWFIVQNELFFSIHAELESMDIPTINKIDWRDFIIMYVIAIIS